MTAAVTRTKTTSDNALISDMCAAPVLRLLCWAAFVLFLAGALQLISWIAGLGLDMTSPRSGRSIAGMLLLAGSLAVMRRSGREPADFGLAIGADWRRHIKIGVGVGAGALILQTSLAVAVGGASLRTPDHFRWFASVFESLAGFPLAVAAAVVYAGFIAGSARERVGPNLSAIFAGAVCAAFHLIYADPSARGDPHQAAVTLGVLAVVAAQLRFISGDIVLGASLLAGVFTAERFIRKAPVLHEAGDAALAPLLTIDRMLLPAPALIAAAVVGVIALAPLAARSAPRERSAARINPSFLRAYPFATMGALAPLDIWLRELARARFKIGGAYILRLVVTLALSAINTIISLPERIIVPIIARRRSVPPPIFILGAHRSGTTHLHNMLALDRAFAAPTAWQVLNPHGFLLSGWLLRPIFSLFAPWRRPMDAVAFGLSEPAEEEFAVANMSGVSPDWSFRLPRMHARYDRFCFPDLMTDRERETFVRAHGRFIRALCLLSRRAPLLKSPHNTGRHALLSSMYPGARFVHIRRDPAKVYCSNINIEKTAHALFQLQDQTPGAAYSDRFPALYHGMESRFYADADARQWRGVCEVRYEDLAANPLRVVRSIYDALGLPWTDEYEARLRDYLARIEGYKPADRRPLDRDAHDRLDAALGEIAQRWRDADAALDSAPAQPVAT